MKRRFPHRHRRRRLRVRPDHAGTGAVQRVSKTEITIACIRDPLAGFGKQARNGMQLRVDGSTNRRHQRPQAGVQAEDSGYDPKRAVLARKNWSARDKISPWWATLAPALTWRFSRAVPENVISFFPVRGGAMYSNQRLKYAFSVPYYDQARTGHATPGQGAAPRGLCDLSGRNFRAGGAAAPRMA